MKMRTSELIGAALDWAVEQAEGGSGLGYGEEYSPSTNWAQGGPLLEREGITTGPWDTSPARAIKGHNHDYKPTYSMVGPTLLVAGMRCFVASRFGDEVEVPQELC